MRAPQHHPPTQATAFRAHTVCNSNFDFADSFMCHTGAFACQTTDTSFNGRCEELLSPDDVTKCTQAIANGFGGGAAITCTDGCCTTTIGSPTPKPTCDADGGS